MVKLSQIAQVIAGQSPESKYYNSTGEGIPFFQGKADFNENFPSVRYWCTHPTKIAKPLDILFSVRAPVGPTNICNLEACIGRGLAAIRCSEELNYKYLYYFFKTIETKLASQGNGSTFSAITTNVLKDLQIPLPPLATQKRIAAILNAADALRRKDQQLLQKYDELAQAIFIDMFGDPVKNEKGWREDIIKNVASNDKHSIKAGPFGSSLKKEYYEKSGYKIYGQEQVIADDFNMGDYYINEEKFQQLKSCEIQEDDILISLVGTYGKISVVPKNVEKGIINPRLMKISLNKSLFNPYFFKFLLQTKQMYDRISVFSRGGTMDIVNVGIISNVKVFIPPIKKQNEFCEMLISIGKQKELIKEKNTNSSLFNALLQKAFMGELVS
jgi:type I restriction enzyme S subunit